MTPAPKRATSPAPSGLRDPYAPAPSQRQRNTVHPSSVSARVTNLPHKAGAPASSGSRSHRHRPEFPRDEPLSSDPAPPGPSTQDRQRDLNNLLLENPWLAAHISKPPGQPSRSAHTHGHDGAIDSLSPFESVIESNCQPDSPLPAPRTPSAPDTFISAPGPPLTPQTLPPPQTPQASETAPLSTPNVGTPTPQKTSDQAKRKGKSNVHAATRGQNPRELTPTPPGPRRSGRKCPK